MSRRGCTPSFHLFRKWSSVAKPEFGFSLRCALQPPVLPVKSLGQHAANGSSATCGAVSAGRARFLCSNGRCRRRRPTRVQNERRGFAPPLQRPRFMPRRGSLRSHQDGARCVHARQRRDESEFRCSRRLRDPQPRAPFDEDSRSGARTYPNSRRAPGDYAALVRSLSTILPRSSQAIAAANSAYAISAVAAIARSDDGGGLYNMPACITSIAAQKIGIA
jgi:hypothetical protein